MNIYKIHLDNNAFYFFSYSKPNTPKDFILLLHLLRNKTINSNHCEYKEVPAIAKNSYNYKNGCEQFII